MVKIDRAEQTVQTQIRQLLDYTVNLLHHPHLSTVFLIHIETITVTILTLKAPNKNAADDILIFYFYLSKKIRFDVSSESST